MLEDIAPVFFYIAVIAFGLVVGSFLNVVIFRLPRGESIVFPGSHCPACGTAVRAWDNTFRFFRISDLAGRVSLMWREDLAQVPRSGTWLRGFFSGLWPGYGVRVGIGLVMMVFVAGLLVAALVDFDHQIIPDSISLGGCAFGLIFVPLVKLHAGLPYVPSLISSVLGVLVGGGTLWLVAFLHARLSVALGREYPHWPGEGEAVPKPREADYWLWFPGMGLGDIKLLAMVGAFLGPWGALDTVVLASLVGLVAGGVWGLISSAT